MPVELEKQCLYSSLLSQCIEELSLMGLMEQSIGGGGLVDGGDGYD